MSQPDEPAERQRFESQIQYLADHDPLTGLLRRRRLEEQLAYQLALASRYGLGGFLLLINLDDFNSVNNRFGRHVGDEVIRGVGALFRRRLRRTDILAYWGADEFAVLLPPRAELHQAQAVANSLVKVLRDNPIPVGGQESVLAGASVGIAEIEERDNVTANDLVAEADVAMCRAKDEGGDRVGVYGAAQDEARRAHPRLTWAERIRRALDGDLFALDYQPILDLRTRKVSQHELLLRMEGEDGEAIAPGEFLLTAERIGLIKEIDRWVLSRAVRAIAEQSQGGEQVTLQVNLSSESVTDPQFGALVESELGAAGIDAASLVLEITETAAIANIGQAKRFIDRLQELGCRIALDDFGAGFGSFYYLKHLPFDYLKIDGGFIRRLAVSEADQHVVKAIVEIGHGFGKQVIAEFVGDEQTLELLASYGTDYAQGYFVGKPQQAPANG